MSVALARQASGGASSLLARVLLPLLLLAGLCTGCLDATPHYTARQPLPPVITAMLVTPQLSGVSPVAEAEESRELTVPFRAEDTDSALQAVLYVDLDPSRPSDLLQFEDYVPVLPSSEPFAEQTARKFVYTWGFGSAGNRTLGAGCHSLTLILTRRDNIDFARSCERVICDPLQAASVVWWFDFIDSTAPAPTPLSECYGRATGGTP